MTQAALRIVRVLDALGNPVAGAFVTVVSGTAPTPEITLLTNAEGRARLGLPPGTFTIRAQSPEGRKGTAEVVGGESPDEIEIRLKG
jgi:hypothetical protein